MRIYSIASFIVGDNVAITALFNNFSDAMTEYDTLRNESPGFSSLPEIDIDDLEIISEDGFLFNENGVLLNITVHELSISVKNFEIDIFNNV